MYNFVFSFFGVSVDSNLLDGLINMYILINRKGGKNSLMFSFQLVFMDAFTFMDSSVWSLNLKYLNPLNFNTV